MTNTDSDNSREWAAQAYALLKKRQEEQKQELEKQEEQKQELEKQEEQKQDLKDPTLHDRARQVAEEACMLRWASTTDTYRFEALGEVDPQPPTMN